LSPEAICARVEDGLAREIHIMLDEGVAGMPEDIDLAMILGAGWPFQMGGATPFLDRVGASQRVNSRPFHSPMIQGAV
jgi:3-hydroxyacyl-CoA dehydrogenase